MIAPVSELTAGVLPVLPAVEVGQPPALGEDGAGEVRPAVIEISRISQSDIRISRYPVKPRHSDICGRLPAVVRDLAVVAGREAGHHPALWRSPPASPALVISPLQISAAVHGSRSEITRNVSRNPPGYIIISFKKIADMIIMMITS